MRCRSSTWPGIERHRLLQQQVLARRQGAPGQVKAGFGWGGDHHRLDGGSASRASKSVWPGNFAAWPACSTRSGRGCHRATGSVDGQSRRAGRMHLLPETESGDGHPQAGGGRRSHRWSHRGSGRESPAAVRQQVGAGGTDGVDHGVEQLITTGRLPVGPQSGQRR